MDTPEIPKLSELIQIVEMPTCNGVDQNHITWKPDGKDKLREWAKNYQSSLGNDITEFKQ